MIVLGHYNAHTGQLYGVWVPPAEESGTPTSYYPDRPDKEAEAHILVVETKGPDPTWADWFDQLGAGHQYGVYLPSFEVPEGTDLETLFKDLLTRV
jgi:hypothetical protein